MYRIYAAAIETAAASIFIIPLIGFYGKYISLSIEKICSYILFALYLTAVLALVGFPSLYDIQMDFTANLVPFVPMAADFGNTCLNILLFIPMGIFLSVFWDKYRESRAVLAFTFRVTVFIELSQFFTFRTTDINDIIANTAGTLIGYGFSRVFTRNFTQKIMIVTSTKELYFICVAVVFIMFFIQPLSSFYLWEIIYNFT